jgi:Ran GTPase-activating protein (RanGAP) involved in mRNA processing and transport
MVREQVRQEAERLADSLGLTMDELYHAPLKDILQVLRRHQREEDSEEELEDEELEDEESEDEESEEEESEEELQEDQLEEEQLEDEELMIMIKGLAEAGYIPKKYVDDAHDLFFSVK